MKRAEMQQILQLSLLSKDENFVVQMPTSAGKTFIAELSILKHLTNYPDKKCIYIAPFRALNKDIKHLIAQKDIPFSNSKIEAINKIIKHQFLLPRNLENRK